MSIHADVAFGAAVAAARKKRGWTQNEAKQHLCRYGLGLSLAMMTRLENGRRPVQFYEAVALAALLGISLDGFVPDPIAICARCGDAPPVGFTCNDCGRGAP